MEVNPAGGSGGKEGRDGWCTPKWLADLIGEVKLDPCSNLRSHLLAAWYCNLEDGGDGLLEDDGDGVFGRGCFEGWNVELQRMETNYAAPDWIVFVNPPYARSQVIRWIRHYGHTRFIFLLRWDPSTLWFRELLPKCTHVWFPDKRINFEPPPGVKGSNNPFPHALYLRQPSDELLGRLACAGYVFPVDTTFLRLYGGGYDERGETGAGNRVPQPHPEREEGRAGVPPGTGASLGEWDTYVGEWYSYFGQGEARPQAGVG